jgi:hypothetical protein
MRAVPAARYAEQVRKIEAILDPDQLEAIQEALT